MLHVRSISTKEFLPLCLSSLLLNQHIVQIGCSVGGLKLQLFPLLFGKACLIHHGTGTAHQCWKGALHSAI